MSFFIGLKCYSQDASKKAPESKNIKVKILYSKDNGKIAGLTILAKELQLFFAAGENELKSYVEVPLMFDRPGWELAFKKQVLVKADETPRPITIPIYLKKEVSTFSLTAKGPNGEIENQTIYLQSLDSLDKQKNRNTWDPLVLNIGLSNMDYYQQGSGNYKALNWVFAAEYASAPQNWSGLGYFAKIGITALPLRESPIKTGGRFIAAKGDLSYFFATEEESTLRHQVLAGGNYFQLQANGSPFGFNNLMIPDVGYRMHYILNPDNYLIFDARYIAFGMPTQFTKFGFNLSSTYTFKLENFNRMEVGFEILYFQYETLDPVKVKMNTMMLTFGYAI